MEKRGIPKEVLEELDIKKREYKKPIKVTVIVEEHQAKLPIPSKIRTELNLEKGQKCILSFNKKTKELLYKL